MAVVVVAVLAVVAVVVAALAALKASCSHPPFLSMETNEGRGKAWGMLGPGSWSSYKYTGTGNEEPPAITPPPAAIPVVALEPVAVVGAFKVVALEVTAVVGAFKVVA